MVFLATTISHLSFIMLPRSQICFKNDQTQSELLLSLVWDLSYSPTAAAAKPVISLIPVGLSLILLNIRWEFHMLTLCGTVSPSMKTPELDNHWKLYWRSTIPHIWNFWRQAHFGNLKILDFAHVIDPLESGAASWNQIFL